MTVNKKYKELDVVTLKGVIVDVHNDGEAYEVEMLNKNGRTIALFTISHKDLREMEE